MIKALMKGKDNFQAIPIFWSQGCLAVYIAVKYSQKIEKNRKKIEKIEKTKYSVTS